MRMSRFVKVFTRGWRVSYDLVYWRDNDDDDDESVVNRFRFVSEFPRSFTLSLAEGNFF